MTGQPERTALHGIGERYRVPFREPSGRETTEAFSRQVGAQRWLDEQTVALVRGTFVHPELSRQTVGQWLDADRGVQRHHPPASALREPAR